jgi:hypothetical protein
LGSAVLASVIWQIRTQAGSIVHQGMTPEAQLRFRIGRALVCGVRASLSLEVHHPSAIPRRPSAAGHPSSGLQVAQLSINVESTVKCSAESNL